MALLDEDFKLSILIMLKKKAKEKHRQKLRKLGKWYMNKLENKDRIYWSWKIQYLKNFLEVYQQIWTGRVKNQQIIRYLKDK